MSRRDQIQMTEAEREEFLAGPHSASLCTIGADGYPHVTAMWYGIVDGDICFATYGKSQKVKNLERDPKVTVLVEDGASYEELRGVMVQGDAELALDPELAGDVLVDISRRHMGLDVGATGGDAESIVRARAAKRTVIRVHAKRVITWDHRKLGGVY